MRIEWQTTHNILGDGLPTLWHLSNRAYQEKPQMKTVCQVSRKWRLLCKEVLILLVGHLGSAGVGLDLNATCQE